MQGRQLVAYSQTTAHYEIQNDKRQWVSIIGTSSEEETWENKKGQWKTVLTKTLREEHQVDPHRLEIQNRINQMWLDATHNAIVSCNYSINGCR